MAGKVAVITGSSSGIGKEAAAELCEKGFHVVYACRSEGKAKEAMEYAKKRTPGAKQTFMQIDTGKMKSVKAFADQFLKTFDQCDVLVNNAGCGYFKSQERVTEDKLEAFFATNYLSAFLLTKLLMGPLQKANGRVVNLTSIEHWEGSYDFEKVTKITTDKSYATSKLCMMLMAFELARQGEVQAIAVNPGAVYSGIWWYLRGFKKTVWELVAPHFLLSTQQGCATIVHAATADDLPTESCYLSPYKPKAMCPYRSDLIGGFNGATVRTGDPKAYKQEQWKKLWEFSEQQIKPFL